MVAKKHLFVGFGEIATRCAETLCRGGEHVVGVARRERPMVEGSQLWQGDIREPAMLAKVAETPFDSAVITLTPGARGVEAYKAGYFDPVRSLLDVWQHGRAPERILFVSSTSVYGQRDGEWVTEASPTEPNRETANVLCATEKLLLESDLNTSSVRFSGIYGPGRDYLLKQVWARRGGDQTYTNRIHVEDCAGVICHLLSLPAHDLKPCYLASDTAPVKSEDIRRWLAQQLNIDADELVPEPARERLGGKRCDSGLLRESGYIFRYPSYKEGYPEAVARFRDQYEGQSSVTD